MYIAPGQGQITPLPWGLMLSPNSIYQATRSLGLCFWTKISEGFLSYMGVVATMFMWPWPSEQTLIPLTQYKSSIWNTVIICINYDGPECPMLHTGTKFQGYRPFGSREKDVWRVFTIYGHGGHLGQVTKTIWTNYGSFKPVKLHVKYGFNWPQWPLRRCLKMLTGDRISMTLYKSQRMTLTFNDKISSSGHLVNHIYQILYLRLK